MPHGVAAALARGGWLDLPTLYNLAVCGRSTLAEGRNTFRLAVPWRPCLIAPSLAASSGANASMCAAMASSLQWLARCSFPEAGSSAPGGLREWVRTLSAFISARAFSLADAVSWSRRGRCQPGRDGDGLSFIAAPGATDGQLTVARLGNEPFLVMLGVPIRHGVVRWEVLLHRGNSLAIGCTAWPVVGPGLAYSNPISLRNSWMWCPYKSHMLFRGTPGPAGPRWPAILADGAGE